MRCLSSGRATPTARLTPIFSPGDIIRVPFPYVELALEQARSALVVSRYFEAGNTTLIWATMITSAANARWLDDVSLEDDHLSYGLSHPSVVRVAKMATIDPTAARLNGRLDGPKLALVWQALRQALPL